MFNEQISASTGSRSPSTTGSTRSASRPRCRSAARAYAREVKSLEEVPGGAQITVECTFEREGGDKPVCVAETLARVYEG